jgi:general secretion pathway protein N
VNAAGQRRLTPLLGGAVAVLVIVLGVIVSGVGSGVQWDEAGTPEPLPAARPVTLPPPAPLARFAEVWQRPLFMADRKPVAASGDDDTSSNIGDLELTGIIMTSGLRMALLRDRGKDVAVRVKEGAALEDGHWTLASLTPRSAVFDNGGEHKELTLKVSAPEALAGDTKRPGAAPGQPGQPTQPPHAPAPGSGGIRIEQQPVSGMTGPALPRPDNSARQAPPHQDDEALQRARIEALKQAVQKRRMEQQQRQQGQDTQ